MNTQSASTQSLTAKLSTMMREVDEAIQTGAALSFGVLRNMLGRRRVIILPSVKSHTEHVLSDGRVRVAVVLEINLMDAESDERVTSRWLGQAVDEPLVCQERAITRALEDFLAKTFLIPQSSMRPQTLVRRAPQGASDRPALAQQALTPSAQPAPQSQPESPVKVEAVAPPQAATTSPAASPAPPSTASQQSMFEAPASAPPSEGPSKAWKAANALWRALVAEVCGSEVMDEYEAALEREAGVDSWKKVEPEQMREWCAALKRRSALPSDVRRVSDREEYILSHLDAIPASASLNRVGEELHRLTHDVVADDQADDFLNLYMRKMRADGLGAIPGRALVAMCRKLRRLPHEERAAFIEDALGVQDAA